MHKLVSQTYLQLKYCYLLNDLIWKSTNAITANQRVSIHIICKEFIKKDNNIKGVIATFYVVLCASSNIIALFP